MPTGPRGSAPVSPRDVTGARTRLLLRQKAEREAAANDVIDIEAVRREAYDAAFEPAWKAGAEWAFEQLRNAGLDVAAVLDLDHQGDDEDVVE